MYICSPRIILLTNMIKYHCVMLHTCTLYKDSMPSSLSQEIIFMFCLHNLCKTCGPRAGPFLNQATFNKLGKSLQNDSSYQISRLLACSGTDKRQCKDCWVWPLWSQGHNFTNNVVEVHWQMRYTKYQSSRY